MNKDEQILRENIRQVIRHVKQKRIDEEKEIRNSLRTLMRLELKQMLTEAETSDNDPAPNTSTGINVLEDLLKKISTKKKKIVWAVYDCDLTRFCQSFIKVILKN